MSEDNHALEMLQQIDKNDRFDSRLRDKYHNLTRTQRKIADYIYNNRQFVINSSITSLAKKIGTNPSSITRFCQEMRYKGYNELKFYLQNDIFFSGDERADSTKDIVLKDSLLANSQELLNFDISALRETMLLLNERDLKESINLIKQADKIYFFAEGGTGATGYFAYHIFLQAGLTSNFFSDPSLMLLSTAHLTKNDLVIAISFSGNSQHVYDAADAAKQKNVPIIAITGFSKSALSKLANVTLSYSSNIPDDLQYLHVARMCETAIIGLLQSEMLKLMKESKDDRVNISKKTISKNRIK